MPVRKALVPVLLAVILSTEAPAAKRNIVLFVADDQGSDAGCYGNPVVRRRTSTAWPPTGTRFDHAFCTTASCSASRSVILTGLYNHANGQYGHAARLPSFPQLRQREEPAGAARRRRATARCGSASSTSGRRRSTSSIGELPGNAQELRADGRAVPGGHRRG